MDSLVKTEVLEGYRKKREYAENKNRMLKERLVKQIPELGNLYDEINRLSIESLKNSLVTDEEGQKRSSEELKKKLDEINEKINGILFRNGYSIKDLEPKYECEKCKDTGFIGNNYCSCLKQELLNKAYEQSNISKLGEENFDTFQTAFYSNEMSEEYKTNKTPLQNILEIKERCIEFCDNIDNPKQHNLLFIGNTGLGKTFLSNCIADRIIKKGYSVVYQTAPILMDKVIKDKFNYNSNGEEYEKLIEADLLIIDDLGTENLTDMKFTELFNIINTRLLKNKKMIISTNYGIDKLYNKYDERIFSRLIGNFTICKFYGEDIRVKKKKMRIV